MPTQNSTISVQNGEMPVQSISNSISRSIFFGLVRFSFLMLIWFFFVQQNFQDSRVFFISTFIYTGGFIYDFSRIVANYKFAKQVIIYFSGAVLVVFVLTAFIGISNEILLDQDSQKLYINFLGGKYNLIAYKTYIMGTFVMPALATFNFGASLKGGE